jgi:ABC-type transport system involved in cytochrome c biogenesis permease subunit
MERSLYTALALACAATSLLGLVGWTRVGSPTLRRAGTWGGRASLALALLAWLLRWRSAGHLPIFGTWESALSLATAVLLASLLAERGLDPGRVWPVTTAVASALLIHGLFYDQRAFPLTISERSWVVDAHALVAWAAFACLAVNAALAASRLLWRGEPRPAADRRLAFTLGLGFVLHSAMLASGSFYKFLLFGTAWSFDPIETLGFVAWVGYGTLLHLNRMAGWEGRRLAGWCLALFVLLVVSYRAIVYFPAWSTYHIFDMDLRIHVTPSDSSTAGGEP